jgi:hypothetical protein
LGISNFINQNLPNKININSTITKISTGAYHNILLSNNKILVFGSNVVKFINLNNLEWGAGVV